MEPRIASRNWSAVIKSDNIAGGNTHLEVHGEVETSRSNKRARLTEVSPQGINPKILLLDLAIYDEGEIGNEVMGWTKVEFKKSAEHGAYTEVQVRHGSSDVTTIKVQNIHS